MDTLLIRSEAFRFLLPEVTIEDEGFFEGLGGIVPPVLVPIEDAEVVERVRYPGQVPGRILGSEVATDLERLLIGFAGLFQPPLGGAELPDG